MAKNKRSEKWDGDEKRYTKGVRYDKIAYIPIAQNPCACLSKAAQETARPNQSGERGTKKREERKMRPYGSKTVRSYYEEYVRSLPDAKRINAIADFIERCGRHKPKKKHKSHKKKESGRPD